MELVALRRVAVVVVGQAPSPVKSPAGARARCMQARCLHDYVSRGRLTHYRA